MPQRSRVRPDAASDANNRISVSEDHPPADKALLEAKPDWDRMGEIADRLLSTPPDRQAVGKAVAPTNGDIALRKPSGVRRRRPLGNLERC